MTQHQILTCLLGTSLGVAAGMFVYNIGSVLYDWALWYVEYRRAKRYLRLHLKSPEPVEPYREPQGVDWRYNI